MFHVQFCSGHIDICFPSPQPVQSSEHMAALGVFGLCQIHAFVDYLRSKLNAQQFEILFKSVISLVGLGVLSAGTVLLLTGEVLWCTLFQTAFLYVLSHYIHQLS